MFNVVGLENCNPVVIHGSLLMYFFLYVLFFEEKLVHVHFAGFV